MSDIWMQLSFYESTDLIKRFYKKKHNLSINAGKAKEIVSSFAQGREYFYSAKNASDLVRPLLLYYGVLSLSRGLILFLSHNERENSLKNSHGLEVVNWGNELATGINKLPALKIKILNGTFSELCIATSNIERSVIYNAPFPNKVILKRKGDTDFTGEILTVNDIISRIPELYELYETTFNEFSNCFPAMIFLLSEHTHTNVSILETKKGLPDEETIRTKFQIPETIDARFSTSNNFAGKRKNYSFRFPHSDIKELCTQLPPIKNDDLGNIYAVAPINRQINLSKLALLYLVSYSMSMLVRYYPSHWISIISREKGDYAFPIMKAAISVLENLYPKLILEEIDI